MNKQIFMLLFEAYRRNDMADSFEKNKPPTKRWIGLGTEATYRLGIEAGLFRFFDDRTPPKRCLGWLCLTEKGWNLIEENKEEFEKKLTEIKKSKEYRDSYASRFQLISLTD